MSSFFSTIALIVSLFLAPFTSASVNVDSAPIVSTDPYVAMQSYNDEFSYKDFTNAVDNCNRLNANVEDYDDCVFDLATTYVEFGSSYYGAQSLLEGETSPQANRFFNFRDTGVDYGVEVFLSY